MEIFNLLFPWTILFIFGGLFYWRSKMSLFLIVACLPLYLWKFILLGLPTNFLEIAIYGSFIGWFVSCFLSKNKTPLVFGKELTIPIVLIVVGVFLSSLLSINLRVSFGIFKGWLIDPLLVFFMIVNEFQSVKDYLLIYWSIFLSGLAVAITAFGYWFLHIVTYDGRLAAFFPSPNFLAMYLAPGVMVATTLLLTNLTVKKRALLLSGLLIMLFILFFTFSYGAWFGLGLSIFVFLLTAPIKLSRKKIFSMLFVAVLLILLLTQLNSQKAFNLFNPDNSSFYSRLIIWRSALSFIGDNFLLGIGPGTFQDYYLMQSNNLSLMDLSVPHPHNILMSFWLYGGLSGLVGFVWLVVKFFNLIIKSLRQKKNAILTIGALTLMIYFLSHGMLDTTYWKNDLSIMFWLTLAVGYKAYYPTG